MCKSESIVKVYPGEKIAEMLRQNHNMECYGLWSILSSRVHCAEVHEEKVIEILTKDPIAFDLLVGLVKVIPTKSTGHDLIEFKEAHGRNNFISAISHTKQMATAAGSNYIIAINPQPEKNRVQVLFWDLRKFKFF